ASTRHDAKDVQATCPNDFGRCGAPTGTSSRLALIHSHRSRNGEVTRCVKNGRVVSPPSLASSFASWCVSPGNSRGLTSPPGWQRPCCIPRRTLQRSHTSEHTRRTLGEHMKPTILAGTLALGVLLW